MKNKKSWRKQCGKFSCFGINPVSSISLVQKLKIGPTLCPELDITYQAPCLEL